MSPWLWVALGFGVLAVVIIVYPILKVASDADDALEDMRGPAIDHTRTFTPGDGLRPRP